jgi:hypothetical protein
VSDRAVVPCAVLNVRNSMNSTNQYHIDGVYVSAVGLPQTLMFPWAFIPPKGVSKHEFYQRVLVEEVVRLTAGVHVLHRGAHVW